MKYFNITGPCHSQKHYMLPAQSRCQGLMELIDKEHYFVIHAARQSGKTTLLLDLVEQLNRSGRYPANWQRVREELIYALIIREKSIPLN